MRIRTTGTSGYVIADAVKFVPVTEIVLDNADASGVTYSGTWTASTTTPGYYASNYRHDGNANKGSKSATFTPTIPTTQSYQVFMYYPSRSDYPNNVPVDIVHADGTATVTVNQSANGGRWNLLGTYNFSAGTSGYLRIRTTGTTGYVIADAVKWVSAASPAPEGTPEPTLAAVRSVGATPALSITPESSGNILLSWPTLTGTAYTVESSLDGGNTWQPAFETVGDGSTQSFAVKPNAAGAMFRLLCAQGN